MINRLKERFPNPDVILIPGDHAAHKVAALDGQDPTGSAYQHIKDNIASVYQVLSKHFPNTIVLATIGNNDGRYKNEAIDEADKTDYYTFLYQQWFSILPGNRYLESEKIQTDVLAGGYYAVDLPETKYTVLQLNSMYCDIFDAGTSNPHTSEAELENNWLQYQFDQARLRGRMIIFLDHVYAGYSYQDGDLNKPECLTRYFQMLRDNHDLVVIEVVGHEHFSDLRYHSSDNVLDMPNTSSKFNFHNMLITPGISSWDK